MHINLRGLLNAKTILEEEKQWYYLNQVHAFPKSISQKVNVIT